MHWGLGHGRRSGEAASDAGRDGEWQAVEVTMDSGAADNVCPVTAFPGIPLVPNRNSQQGKYYLAANRQKVYVLGEKSVVMRTQEGQLRRITFQVCKVGKILISCGKAVEAGNEVIMSRLNSRVISPTGESTALALKNGVFTMMVQVCAKSPAMVRPRVKAAGGWQVAGKAKARAKVSPAPMDVDHVVFGPGFTRQGC